MGVVGASFSMSLDGFIAGPNDDMSRIFAWYFSGDTDVTFINGEEDMGLKVSETSAEVIQEPAKTTGAIVSGRRMFDVAGAWGGKHPLDVPVFVVTHRVPQEWVKAGSPFTFVTDGVESAIAQAQKVAGDKNVGVGGASIAQECIRLGILDEIQIDLVPVLLGQGIRLFEHLGVTPIELGRTRVIEARDVTHLGFRIRK